MKRLRKSILIGSIISVIVLIIISILLVDSKIQQGIAKEEKIAAEKAQKKAVESRKTADLATEAAREASILAEEEKQKALNNEKVAKIATSRAILSEKASKDALLATKKANIALDDEKNKLSNTVKALETSTKAERVATTQANNARKYQESLYVISSLRNEVQKKNSKMPNSANY